MGLMRALWALGLSLYRFLRSRNTKGGSEEAQTHHDDVLGRGRNVMGSSD